MKELIKKIESLRDNFESNYALEENAYTRACEDIIELVEQLRIHDVVGRSEQLVCDICDGSGFRWSPYYAKEVVCDCKK